MHSPAVSDLQGEPRKASDVVGPLGAFADYGSPTFRVMDSLLPRAMRFPRVLAGMLLAATTVARLAMGQATTHATNHWAFTAPSKPVVPKVSRPPKGWPRNDIDAFILQ
ncbi:MAG: hypothetical protein RL153_1585, partial [Verrucomicrobiota bacterium]